MHLEICKTLESKKYEIIFLQKPYGSSYAAKSNFEHIDVPTGYSRYVPSVDDTLVCILYRAFRLTQYDSKHLMALELLHLETRTTLIAVKLYCQFSQPLEGMLARVECIVQCFPRNTIIGTDANTRSPIWFSEDWDNRGKDWIEFILHHNLDV